MIAEHPTMSDSFAALRAFKARRGRNWIEDLSVAWHNGNYRRFGCDSAESSHLQSIRNHPSYGGDKDFLENFQ